MPNSVYCDQDRFAIALNEMLQEVVTDVDGSTMPVVRNTCKLAKEEVKKNASSYGWKDYPNEFAYTTSRRRLVSLGEVGNKSRPGLVHLLEKGHAKMGGGRVAARPHMAQAADTAFDYFWEEIGRAVDGALK